jgi:hypothetical protein
MIKEETIQNKRQIVAGTDQHDLILKTKGKVSLQIGRTFVDLTKTFTTNPQIPGVYPISSKDFIKNSNEFNYDIDMREFNCISANFKLSELDKTETKYIVNLRLLAAYDYKLNTAHFNIINDTNEVSTIMIEINFINIDEEAIFGFEEMPIMLSFDNVESIRSRFLIFYYDPEIKYWFNPLY